MMRRSLFSVAMLIGMAGAAPALAQAPAAAPDATAPASADARLRQLFHDSDEANLRRNPFLAIFRGDYRYADRLGDGVSDAWYAAERAAAEHDLAVLHAIPRDRLDPVDRIAYDVFDYQRKEALADFQPDMMALTAVRPMNHLDGLHIYYPIFASGHGAAPFRNVKDYEDNLARHRQFVRLLDLMIGRFRQGLASGVVETKLTIGHVIEQLDTQLRDAPEDSPFYAPVLDFPDAVPEVDRPRLRDAYVREIRDGIFPAYQRLRDFLQNEYLPHARTEVGLSAMRGGERMYARLIEKDTTLPMSAEEIHDLGLAEVARIRGEMETIKARVGFSGTLAQFFEYLRTDPRFVPKSCDALRDGYRAIGRRVDARVREIFSTIPRSPLEIRRVEPLRERTEAAGTYMDGTPDGSRPGIFYYNCYDLPSRATFGMETLYLHEAVPGHHFQLMLAAENADLPSFMRFGRRFAGMAFIEGWALYAETLWDELGMETDPYQRFGGLNDEMLRAMRLVVDTGIHAKGWSRERAIRYMLDNSGMSRTDVTAEVERYIATPGQALAYKIGALTILRLRREAEEALGPRFDLRAFHGQVLDTGALPMPVLERKIRDWIAAQRGTRTAR